MERRKGITAIVGFVLLAIVVTLAVDSENTESKNKDVMTHDYTFTGESEHWRAVFEVEGEEVFHEEDEVLQREEKAQSEFRLTYKGSLDGLSSVNEMCYEYQTPTGSSETSLIFNETQPDDTVFTNFSDQLVRQSDVIEVTVEWGDSTESFTLEAEE